MDIKIIRTAIAKNELRELAKQQFGDFVKVVVDVERGIMAIGGELHADEEAMLLDEGSMQRNLWGVNVYPDLPSEQWIEYDSMINVRPSQGNRSRNVEDAAVRKKIASVVMRLVQE